MQAYNYMFNTENTLEHAYIRFILGLVTSLSKYSNSFLRLMMSRCMHGENAVRCRVLYAVFIDSYSTVVINSHRFVFHC